MATEVTAEDVKAYATEYAQANDTRIELFLEYSDNFINEEFWGRKYKMAKVLMTCHLMKMDERNGTGGAITSERVGDLQVAYAAPDAKNGELGSTSYGQTFLSLRKTLTITPMVL